MFGQDDLSIPVSIAIGVVVLIVVIFVLGLLCGLLGLIMEHGGFINAVIMMGLT